MHYLNKVICGLTALFIVESCQSFDPAPPLPALSLGNNAIVDDSNVVVLMGSQEEANRLLVNAARRNYQLIEKTRLSGLGLTLLDFKRPPGVSGQVAIADMQRMSPSSTAGLNHLYTLQNEVSAAPSILPETNINQPRLYARTMVEWPNSGCQAQTLVGMIDGHVDTTSPELSSVDIVIRQFSRGAPTDVEHGTAIADLLVGKGSLNNARLFSASVISDVNPTDTGAGVYEIIRALDWLQASGVKVVNISLAGPYNKLLDRAIQRATDKGMLIVAAVGNDGPDASPRYPAAFENVIAVTAIDSERDIYTQAVHGDHVDFSAPGVDVFIESGKQANYLSGTSVAAPFVTALIASNPDLPINKGVKKVRNAISQQVVDLGQTGRDPIYGTGLIQAGQSCQFKT